MIIRSERDIADHVADGRLTVCDADTVRTFAAFLRELGGRSLREALQDGAWRARWRGYVLGDADGPATSHPVTGCAASPDDPHIGQITEEGDVSG